MPRRRRRWLRWVLVVTGFVLILVGVGLAYLNYVFLPRYGEALIREALDELLGRKVTLGEIHWSILHGARIDGVSVAASFEQDAPFFQVERVHVRYSLGALLRGRLRLAVVLVRPQATLLRGGDGSWNVSDLIERFRKPPRRDQRIVLGSLAVQGGTLVIADAARPEQTERIESLRVEYRFGRRGRDYVAVSGYSTRAGAEFAVKARHEPLRHVWDCEFSIPESDLAAVHKFVSLPLVTVAPARAHVSGSAAISLANSIEGNVRVRSDAIDVKGKTWRFTGGVDGLAKVSLPLKRNGGVGVTFGGACEVRDATLDLPKHRHTYTHLGGLVRFDRSGLKGEGLTARWETVRGKGDFVLTGFDHPVLHLDFAVSGPTAEFIRFIRPDRPISGVTAVGTASARVVVDGPLDTSPDAVAFDVDATLMDNTVALGERPLERFDHLSATLKASQKLVEVRSFDARWQGEPLSGRGSVEIASSPLIAAAVTLGGTDVQCQVRFQPDGTGDTFEAAVHAVSDVKRLAPLLPERVRSAVNPLALSGTVAFDGGVAGPVRHPADWEIQGDATFRDLTVSHARCDALAGKVYLKERVFKAYDLAGTMFSGTLRGAAEVDFRAQPVRYKCEADLSDLDFEKAASWVPSVKKRDIRGRFSLKAVVNGVAGKPDRMIGIGKAKLSEGYIWEIELFRGLFNFLSLRVPGIARVVFNKIQGDFQIEHGRISTENLYFSSPTLKLQNIGWVDFAGNVDLKVTTQLAREKGAFPERLVREVINIPGHLLPRARVKGTLSRPEYSWYVLPRFPIVNRVLNTVTGPFRDSGASAGEH